jgi:HAE1 family hydrophobic/amphiphilic exporter-1
MLPSQIGNSWTKQPLCAEWFDIVLFVMQDFGEGVERRFHQGCQTHMHRITALSLRQRSVVILATILIMLLGVAGLTRLKTELFPDINIPVLTVITTYPGADPNAVDITISQPIATQIENLVDLDTVTTQSQEGFSVVIAEFEFGTDMGQREQELIAALNGVALPDGAGRPEVTRISFNQFPIVQIALTQDDADLGTLRTIATTQFSPAIQAVDGVGNVEVIGGADDLLLIQLDPASLTDLGITAQSVAQALQANNLAVPVGAIADGDQTLPVRVAGQPSTIADVEALIVANDNGTPVTLGEIADVAIGAGGSPGVARTNGELSVAIDIYMRQGANTVETAEGALAEVERIEAELAAAGTPVTVTLIQDQAEFINHSIDQLVREAVLGAIFAILVIFVFLLSVRSTIVTAISIPASVLVAFIVLWTQGITINIMTLGGLAVAIGRVIDDSIVVLEAIFRHIQAGKKPRQAALDGTREVALAITASTITTVCVFLPLGFVGGIIGEVFRPFALTVSFSLLASLLVALTVVPVLASYLITIDKIRAPKPGNTRLQNVYEPMIRTAVRRPKLTILVATLALVASFALIPLIGTSFLPSSGEKIVSITVDLPAGSSQETTLALATELEAIVQETVPVELIQTQIGGDGLIAAFTGATSSRATMTATLDPDVDIQDEMANLREALVPAAGQATVTVGDASGGFGATNEVQIIVTGADYAQVSDIATRITAEVTGAENLVNVENDVVTSKPEIVVTVDPAAAAAAGLSTQQVAAQVAEALNGANAGFVTIDGQPFQTIVSSGTQTADSLASLPIGPNRVLLGDIATVGLADGPVQVIRIDGERAATVSASITSEDTGSVNMDVQAIVDRFADAAPAGIEISAGGVAADQEEAFAGMAIALLVAVALVYLVMVVSFGSLSTPFVILFSLPLALIGVLGALAITGKTLGLPALIGVLMLVGIVVTNAIVLLEYVIELRHKGRPLDEAIIEGGKVRLRPILMTAIATILALTPLAASTESGAIIASDLAVVVIGGLLTSTLLTLLVVPAAYKIVGGWHERRAAKSADRDDAPLVEPTL